MIGVACLDRPRYWRSPQTQYDRVLDNQLNKAKMDRLLTATGQYEASVQGVLKELDSYRALGYDWDSYEALPVASEAVDAAKKFVCSAFARMDSKVIWKDPIPAPTPDG